MIKVKDVLTFNKEANFVVVINGKEVNYNLTWEDVDEESLTEEQKAEYEAADGDSRKITPTVIIEVE